MSLNLIEAAKGLFTNDLVNKASLQFGESESGISRALSGIIPSVFGGLLNKTKTTEGAGTVAQMVREQQHAGVPDNLGNWFGAGNNDMLSRGAGLLGGLFGNKSDGLAGLISNFAGVKSSTSNSLLGMIVPAILGLIGKHAGNTEPSAISSLLSSQKDHIKAAMPAGLNLGSVIGDIDDGPGRVIAGSRTTTTDYTDRVDTKSGSSKWLLPLLLLAALGIAAWYFLGKGCNRESDVVSSKSDTSQTVTTDADVNMPVTSTTGRYDSVTNEYVYNPGNNVTIDLPNNAGKLEVGEYSTENRLYRFLSDANSTIDTAKGNWFEFTNVKFKTGSSQITDESMTQLRNLVAISKAFPTAQFKLGGYTDNTGDAAANVALSQKRAEAVAAELKKLGAASSSIGDAKGYGPEWPVADNATPEGRAQNRRVAVNVKSK